MPLAPQNVCLFRSFLAFFRWSSWALAVRSCPLRLLQEGWRGNSFSDSFIVATLTLFSLTKTDSPYQGPPALLLQLLDEIRRPDRIRTLPVLHLASHSFRLPFTSLQLFSIRLHRAQGSLSSSQNLWIMETSADLYDADHSFAIFLYFPIIHFQKLFHHCYATKRAW